MPNCLLLLCCVILFCNSSALDCFGPKVKASGSKYDRSLYRKDLLMKKDSNLKCNFEKACCWTNQPERNGYPLWKLGEGKVAESEVAKCFENTKKVPSGKFLVANGRDAVSPQDNYIFKSCNIECSSSNVTVTFRKWIKNGKLFVCKQNQFNALAMPDGCKIVQLIKQGGASSISLPIDKPFKKFQVVFLATSLKKGNYVAIDDITVTWDSCPGPTTPVITTTRQPSTAVPTTTTKATTTTASITTTIAPTTTVDPRLSICNAVICLQNPILCGGTNALDWTAVQSIGNTDTGVRVKPPSNSNFLATRLDRSTSEVVRKLETPYFQGATPYTVRYYYYEATDDMRHRVCTVDLSNIENCRDISDISVSLADRAWKVAQVPLSAQMMKLSFQAVSGGTNVGYFGMSDLGLYDASGQQLC